MKSFGVCGAVFLDSGAILPSWAPAGAGFVLQLSPE